METWNAITARRNVRDYTDRRIADEDLTQILEAGRRTPSSMNQQPWDFVVSTERTQLEELAQVWQYATHVARSAATISLIAAHEADGSISESVQYDLGQATMSMMIAAADLGIGTAHAAVSEQELARQILGLPQDRSCAWLISLGYPAGRPLTPMKRPTRRPLDDVVHMGQW
jgi:nitroreductase